MITIDYKSRVPIYDQITAGFIRLKTLGVLKPHDKLPSVRSMASSLGINPNTVQKAYAILEADGVIYSVSGKGSFISDDQNADAAILSAAKNDFKMAVENAKSMGLSFDELTNVLQTVFGGGEKND
ncbi:MAG: GntR family transcriptional regulator [Clostridia bacterium]|nr:GntR family transcriptional regulator [Clostridia bacterium]